MSRSACGSETELCAYGGMACKNWCGSPDFGQATRRTRPVSWTMPDGRQIAAPRRGYTTAQKERARALAMAGLRDKGWSLREIGQFFGVHNEVVRRTIGRIPPEARRLRGA